MVQKPLEKKSSICSRPLPSQRHGVPPHPGGAYLRYRRKGAGAPVCRRHREDAGISFGRRFGRGRMELVEQLGGGFKYFLFSSLLGEMIQFD